MRKLLLCEQKDRNVFKLKVESYTGYNGQKFYGFDSRQSVQHFGDITPRFINEYEIMGLYTSNNLSALFLRDGFAEGVGSVTLIRLDGDRFATLIPVEFLSKAYMSSSSDSFITSEDVGKVIPIKIVLNE